MKKYHIVIIGGGVAGLCCGLRLLHAGYQVSLYEKCPDVGGVIQSIPTPSDYADYDGFASIGIHPYAYRQIFIDVGLNPDNYFSAIELEDLYRLFYEDGSSFTVRKNTLSKPSEFESFYKESFTHYHDFITTFYKKYLSAHELILSRSLTDLKDAIDFDTSSHFIKLNPLFSASFGIKRRFHNPKLRDFLLFQCYFMGFSPSHISQLYAHSLS